MLLLAWGGVELECDGVSTGGEAFVELGVLDWLSIWAVNTDEDLASAGLVEDLESDSDSEGGALGSAWWVRYHLFDISTSSDGVWADVDEIAHVDWVEVSLADGPDESLDASDITD